MKLRSIDLPFIIGADGWPRVDQDLYYPKFGVIPFRPRAEREPNLGTL